MRQSIRAEVKAGAENIAVVCGAWHAPAIAELGPAAPDQRTLRGLPKVKVAATWVPWTYGLLARDSGYGAGVDSPAWYDQLFDAADQPVARWLARAARLLRAEGLDASAAQVVDATRLAGALAGVRERPLAGPRRAARRDPRRAVLRLRRAARARPARAGGRHAARRGPARDADGAAPAGRRAAAAAAAAEAGGERQGAHARPAPPERPRAQPAPAPAQPARGAVGHARVRERGAGHVQGGVPARVAAVARARPDPRRAAGGRRSRRRPRRRRARRRPSRRASPRWRRSTDAVLLADLPDALDDVLRALVRPGRAGPRHRRPDGRRPAAGRDPALRRRPRQRHDRRRRRPARDRAAQRGRAPGRGRRRRRGDGREARRARRRRQRARSRCCEDEPLTRAFREALHRVADRRPAPRHPRRPRHPAALRRGRDRPGRRDVPRALAGRGTRTRRLLDRGLHRHLRARARPRRRPARDPRRLDRVRRPGRVHERPPTPAPSVLRPPGRRTPPPRRTPPRT